MCLFKLKQLENPSINNLGYKEIEVLAIYPIAVKASSPREEGYGDWCRSLLHIEALCIADGDITTCAYDDIFIYGLRDGPAEYEVTK